MRRKILAANWKMNLLKDEARELFEFNNGLEVKENREVIIFPPFIYLEMGVNIAQNDNISIGSQNVFYEEKGAFTGEISPYQIKDMGVKYSIIGHSERRNIFGEKNSDLNKKIKALLKAGITPVLCIGEPKEEREKKTYEAFLYKQLKEALVDINIDDVKTMIFAYEPIWAIGTGISASPTDIRTTLQFLRETLNVMYEGLKEDVHLLYGGSVNSVNIDEIMNIPNVDGVLVGGASLKKNEWEKIVNFEVK